MKINPSIFKAYDIRGIYPEEINEEAAYFIGRGYVKFLDKKNPIIVVGRDNRLSSPSLFRALIKGITDQGGNVINIGLSTTPILYWACAHFGFDGGVEITASHNPPQYNGFKMVRGGATPISEKTGLKEIKALAEAKSKPAKSRGRVIKKEILKDYVKFNLKQIDITKLKPLKIIVDTANAVPGIVIPEIFKKFPGKIYHLFQKLDGNFPNHPPNPLVKENLRWLQDSVKQKKANLGVAFDGDGDRIFFVTENGKIISADLIIAFLAKSILREKPGEKILYDVRSSSIVKETIQKNGGRPVIWKVGHSFIKEKMRRENITFAGEFSGHYYHKAHYFAEAPFFVVLKILEHLSESKKTISQILKPYQVYFHSGEINFRLSAERMEEKEKKIKELKNRYKNGKILEIDGLRVDFKDWWFLVRPSHTEPVLRLIVEAKTKKLMEQKKKELTTHILG